MSNSTAPSYETGDIVLLDKHVPFSQYKVGDAVLYSPPNFGEIIIHRIYAIQEINGRYFFAIKGDSNPQPDSVPQTGDIKNELLTNKTITWTTFYNSSTTNPTAKYVVASFYPADEVVFGKVIYRIPVIGWLFVPFNSPLSEPFHVLPISMFSLFSIYYGFLIIVTFFLVMNTANSELNKFLNSLTITSQYIRQPSRIKLRYFYSLVFYPMILFLLIFFSASPSPLTNIDTISLQSATTNNQGTTHLLYREVNIIESTFVKQDNVTTISLLFTNNSKILTVNVTKDSINNGQNINTLNVYNITKHESYNLTIESASMFVINSSKKDVPELGRFFDYMIPVTTSGKNPVGLMTQNVFLESTNDIYNNVSVFTTHLNFSFIQDLIQFTWNVRAHFSQNSGYLLYLQVAQTEALWGIPETIGIMVISLGIVALYNIIRNQFQKMLDEKQENIIRSQSANKNQTNPVSDLIPDSQNENNRSQVSIQSKMNVLNANISNKTPEQDQSNVEKSKKKLSWEEYQKLEDKK